MKAEWTRRYVYEWYPTDRTCFIIRRDRNGKKWDWRYIDLDEKYIRDSMITSSEKFNTAEEAKQDAYEWWRALVVGSRKEAMEYIAKDLGVDDYEYKGEDGE